MKPAWHVSLSRSPKNLLASSLVLALALLPASVRAAAGDAKQEKPGTTELGIVEVKARQAAAPVVLPTAAPVDGPFGPGRSVLDTPRSVTPISAGLMRAAGVNDLRDIMKLAPDTYSPTDFGAPSLPDIRGQLGEVFEDGLRQQGGNNGFGVPLSFNAVESMDVVKGPPPVVLGTTQRVGGFVNLGLKRPDLDTPGGYVELGTGSWHRNQGQLDYSTPITPGKSAVRLSVEDHNEGSYYDYAHHHSQDVYLAYRLKPDAVSELNVSVEYYHVNFKDIAGINRPTQNLIDHGLYVTGQGVQPDGSTVPGPFAVISPTGEVRIPRHRVLTDPADRDSVRTWIAHVRYERSLGDDTRYISRTYYQHLSRNEVANDSFVEIIKGADTAEHRSELVLDRDADLFGRTMHQQTDLGLDVRWNHVLGYSQFDTEADLPVDLTGPVSNRRIPLTPDQKAQLVLLRPGLYVSPGAQYPRDGQAAGYMLSDTTDSNSYQTGLFVQHEIHFTPQWSAMAGVRGDEYYVAAKDPLPPPGQVAAHDSVHHFLKAANGSVTWNPVDAVALYAAGSYSQSTSNSIGGGTPLGAGNRIDPANFATDSTLYEIGLKLAPPQGHWYADVSLFDQTRSLRNRDGSNSGIHTKGLDAQWFYQASHLFASAGLSYLDARYDNSASFQDTVQVLDAFNNSRPDIVAGTGVGAPNFAAFPPSSRRLQGLPSVTASALVGYTFDSGLGGTLSGNYTNAFPLDYLATVWIRAQYTLNASVFYRWKTTGTEIRLALNNLTNQKNWAPVFDGGYFGATDVFPELPFNMMFSVRQSF
ncbi:MAG: TonB-dependent receptor plug domain-containing protein [Xanthomonadaceae bacterium]|nr:TonB-dependent receptor plug domain-containing protein [Xanthomonadaceae bacterium]